MSPDPRMTTRFPGSTPLMLMRRWAWPAVKMPGRPVPLQEHLPVRALAAACCHDHAAAAQLLHASPRRHQRDGPGVSVPGKGMHEGAGLIRDVAILDCGDVAAGILGAREPLSVLHDSKPVVDALLEDASQPLFALHDQDARSGVSRGPCCLQPCRASADHGDVRRPLSHAWPPSRVSWSPLPPGTSRDLSFGCP